MKASPMSTHNLPVKTRPIRVYMMDLLATVPYYTAYLARALLQDGVNVRVGSITYYLDPQCFRERGLRLDPGCVDVVGRFASLPRFLRRVAKLSEMALNLAALTVRFLLRPPHILHVQYLPMLRTRLPLDYLFVLAVRRRGARIVLTVHDVLPHDTANRYRAKFTRLYRNTDQLICHSTHVAQRLAQEFDVSRDRIHVIPHGPFFFDLPAGNDTALRTRYALQDGRLLVLWQGILFPYKGLDVLLDAWQAVEAAGVDAILIVAGTGAADLFAQAQAQVKQLGLRNVILDVRFIPTEDLVDLYRAADVVVYPYRQITTSGALATGISLGKPVIASDLPVFRELLTDDVDAMLVPPGDVPALAGAILRVLHDPALRSRLSAVMQAKDFGATSWLRIAADTKAVYEQALHSTTPDADTARPV